MVVIAHRPSVLRFIDKILVLRGGTVEAFGPRDEVMSKMQQDRSPIPATSDASKVIDAEPIPSAIPATPPHATDPTRQVTRGTVEVSQSDTGQQSGAATETKFRPTMNIQSKKRQSPSPQQTKARPEPPFVETSDEGQVTSKSACGTINNNAKKAPATTSKKKSNAKKRRATSADTKGAV